MASSSSGHRPPPRRKSGQLIYAVRESSRSKPNYSNTELAEIVMTFAKRHPDETLWYRIVFWRNYKKATRDIWYKAGTGSTEYYYRGRYDRRSLRDLSEVLQDDNIRVEYLILGSVEI